MTKKTPLVYQGEEIILHSKEDFKKMHDAGKLASKVLDYIEDHIRVGISTEALDTLCHKFILDHQARPAPLNYRGFPKSTCISLNHVVCHGIPSPSKKLQKGDILNIDVSVELNGWYGDTSRMFAVGKASRFAQKLMIATYDAMMKAIDLVRPGVTLGDLGATIQEHAESKGYGVVREFCGHGIGQTFHAPPNILHYGEKGKGLVLEEGMFFTIEPMINAGKKDVKMLDDGWTAVTKDRSLSAQWEHAMGVTSAGVEVFTFSEKYGRKVPWSSL